jgi:triacylglycerol lipase
MMREGKPSGPGEEPRSLSGEWRAVGEWARLLADPLYWGRGVPRGDGRLVLVLPGLFGSDLYLQPLRTWLGRVGYRPLHSTLSVNAGCYERLTRQAEKQLLGEMPRRPGRVAVIGHSRGGMLARAIAARLDEQASHLALLGSPVGAFLRMSQEDFDRGVMPPGHSAIVDASLRARRLLDPDCEFPGCGCAFAIDLRRPLSPRTRVLSVYSRDDMVVPPSASMVPGARNVEVDGTHSGLVYNRATYHELASLLTADE